MKQYSKVQINVKNLYKLGVHYGSPKVKLSNWSAIFGFEKGQPILNLSKTVKSFIYIESVLKNIVYNRGNILFAYNWRGHSDVISGCLDKTAETIICGRWKSGLLSNYFNRSLIQYNGRGNLVNKPIAGKPNLGVLLESSSLNCLKILDELGLDQYKIPTIGIVNSDSYGDLLTYTIPGQTEHKQSVHLFSALFTKVILYHKIIDVTLHYDNWWFKYYSIDQWEADLTDYKEIIWEQFISHSPAMSNSYNNVGLGFSKFNQYKIYLELWLLFTLVKDNSWASQILLEFNFNTGSSLNNLDKNKKFINDLRVLLNIYSEKHQINKVKLNLAKDIESNLSKFIFSKYLNNELQINNLGQFSKSLESLILSNYLKERKKSLYFWLLALYFNGFNNLRNLEYKSILGTTLEEDATLYQLHNKKFVGINGILGLYETFFKLKFFSKSHLRNDGGLSIKKLKKQHFFQNKYFNKVYNLSNINHPSVKNTLPITLLLKFLNYNVKNISTQLVKNYYKYYYNYNYDNFKGIESYLIFALRRRKAIRDLVFFKNLYLIGRYYTHLNRAVIINSHVFSQDKNFLQYSFELCDGESKQAQRLFRYHAGSPISKLKSFKIYGKYSTSIFGNNSKDSREKSKANLKFLKRSVQIYKQNHGRSNKKINVLLNKGGGVINFIHLTNYSAWLRNLNYKGGIKISKIETRFRNRSIKRTGYFRWKKYISKYLKIFAKKQQTYNITLFLLMVKPYIKSYLTLNSRKIFISRVGYYLKLRHKLRRVWAAKIIIKYRGYRRSRYNRFIRRVSREFHNKLYNHLLYLNQFCGKAKDIYERPYAGEIGRGFNYVNNKKVKKHFRAFSNELFYNKDLKAVHKYWGRIRRKRARIGLVKKSKNLNKYKNFAPLVRYNISLYLYKTAPIFKQLQVVPGEIPVTNLNKGSTLQEGFIFRK